MNEKIFVPLEEDNGRSSRVADHFGHAPFFALYDIEKKECEIFKNDLDHRNPDRSPVDQISKSYAPTTVFARQIGQRAIKLFGEKNIMLLTGPYHTLQEVIDNHEKLTKLENDCGH